MPVGQPVLDSITDTKKNKYRNVIFDKATMMITIITIAIIIAQRRKSHKIGQLKVTTTSWEYKL